MTVEYGKRLLVTTLKEIASKDPERVFAVVSNTENIADGFHNVNFGQIARAVDTVSHLLQDRFKDKDPKTNPTLTYAGIQDLRYNIIFYAAIQCRFKILLPSLRNNINVNASLMEQTDSSWFVYTSDYEFMAKELESFIPDVESLLLPPLEELLNAEPKPFPYDYSFDKIKYEKVLVLHSSGSTGRPKPISMTHGTLASMDSSRNFPITRGRRNLGFVHFNNAADGNNLIYSPFPLFHLVGCMWRIIAPIYLDSTQIYGPPRRPASGSLAAEVLKKLKVHAGFLPPTVIEQLHELPDGVELLSKLEMVAFGGGPLPEQTGNEVAKHTKLYSMYGSTEFGYVTTLEPAREDWEYLEPSSHAKVEMQKVEDGLWEMVVFSDGPEDPINGFLGNNFPDAREWRTKDVFTPHPSKPNLWKFHSRLDDIIVLSSGEKLNPIPMESHLTTVPGIDGAVVIGQGQASAALILELDPDHKFPKDPLDELWPSIEKANAEAPAHGKIARSRIILSDKKKPFPRTGKGTTIRKKTEALYEEEAKKMYAAKQAKQTEKSTIQLRASTFDYLAIRDFVRTILTRALGGQELEDTDDLFSHGLDSVSTIEAVGLFKANLLPHRSEEELKWITPDTLYDLPSIAKLSAVFSDFLNKGKAPKRKDRVAEMQKTIDKYAKALPADLPANPRTPMTEGITVAITGSTGFLGRHLVAKLVCDPAIAKIYCLDRSTSASQNFQRHAARSDIRYDASKLKFFQIKITENHLGLTSEDYEDVSRHCDVIFHNAWKVDFNLNLESFADHLNGLKSIIDMSASSPRRPRVMVTSSVSATGVASAQGAKKRIVPEALPEDLNVASPMGYGESKLVSEYMVDNAAKAGIDGTVLRVGQIAAGTEVGDSAWPLRDAIPIMYQTSKTMGVAPNNLEPVDWLPVNWMVDLMSDIIKKDLADNIHGKASFYNLVNPTPTAWTELLPVLQKWCGPDTKAVSIRDWISELKTKENLSAEEQEKFPALKALSFFTTMPESGPAHGYETDNVRNAGKHSAELKPISGEMLKTWLNYM